MAIKILLGGSPCTYWSVCRTEGAKIERETSASGLGWELFKNYLIAKEKFKPDIFLYENVVSMASDIKEQITVNFDVEPFQIDGGLLSAATRDRYYWTNIVGVEPPPDKGLVLKDVLENEVAEKYYYHYPVEDVDMSKQVCAKMIFKNNDMHKRVFNPNFKVHTLTTCQGGNTQKKVLINGRVRKLTPLEYERCMTLPDGYTACVADIHRYNALGNGWVAELIIFLLNHALKDVPRDEEIVVLSLSMTESQRADTVSTKWDLPMLLITHMKSTSTPFRWQWITTPTLFNTEMLSQFVRMIGKHHRLAPSGWMSC